MKFGKMLANTFSSHKQYNDYADLPSFLCPCFITGESFGTDFLLLTDKNILYILELTLGFETNMQSNRDRKAAKFSSLISDLSFSYRKVKFTNLFMSAIGAMGSSCKSLLSLLNDLHFNKTIQKIFITKAMNISIRSGYYIFCRQNKPWTNPELLTLKFLNSFHLFISIAFFYILQYVKLCTLFTSKTIIHCRVCCEAYYCN